jgi:hypothetical protein
MSNLLFNIRFGYRHLQVEKNPFKITWEINYYWINNKPTKWLAIYCWFGKHYY